MFSNLEWWKVMLGLNTLLWPVLQGFMIYAAILFFRADRRLHTGCFLVGSCLALLMALWRLLTASPRFGGGNFGSPGIGMAISFGLTLIAHGLIVYGLVVIALIQSRQSGPPAA